VLRVVLLVLGFLCVGLAGLGIALPVLPTTPFLLLAAFFFARSSPRFSSWLLSNRVFGAYLRNYYEGRYMRPLHKAVTLALLWVTLGLTAWLVVTALWLRILLGAVAIGVTVHLLTLRSRARPPGREG
jgi:hypothetical protein